MIEFPTEVIGFHGTKPRSRPPPPGCDLVQSDQHFEWLGTGLYLWQDSPWRAQGWAVDDELRALGAPCIVIGTCPSAPADWACIDASEFDKPDQFIRRFVAEVSRLIDLPTSEPCQTTCQRTTTDGSGRRRTSSCGNREADR